MSRCEHDNSVVCCVCRPDLWNPTREQVVAWSTEALSKILRRAKRLYYKHGKSGLRDEEYDAIERSLRTINPNAPVLTEVGFDDTVLDTNT